MLEQYKFQGMKRKSLYAPGLSIRPSDGAIRFNADLSEMLPKYPAAQLFYDKETTELQVKLCKKEDRYALPIVEDTKTTKNKSDKSAMRPAYKVTCKAFLEWADMRLNESTVVPAEYNTNTKTIVCRIRG